MKNIIYEDENGNALPSAPPYEMPQWEGESDHDYMIRVHEAYPPQPNWTYVGYTLMDGIPFVDHHDIDHPQTTKDNVAFKENPVKIAFHENAKIDVQIRALENGMPRIYRNIAMGPKAAEVLSISPDELAKVQDKAVKLETQIVDLRNKKVQL